MSICTYCGSSQNIENDHLIPYSYNHLKTSYRINKSKRGTVPACRECNGMLGNKFYTTISQRAAYLLTKYNKKYDKLSNLPSWTEEELSELGPTLKSTIEMSILEKKNLSLRCRHMKSVLNE